MNVSLARRNARAQSLQIGCAFSLMVEGLSSRSSRCRENQRRAERNRIKRRLHCRISLQFDDEHPTAGISQRAHLLLRGRRRCGRPAGAAAGAFSPVRRVCRRSWRPVRRDWRRCIPCVPAVSGVAGVASVWASASEPVSAEILRLPPAREGKPPFAAKPFWFLLSSRSSLLAGLSRPPFFWRQNSASIYSKSRKSKMQANLTVGTPDRRKPGDCSNLVDDVSAEAFVRVRPNKGDGAVKLPRTSKDPNCLRIAPRLRVQSIRNRATSAADEARSPGRCWSRKNERNPDCFEAKEKVDRDLTSSGSNKVRTADIPRPDCDLRSAYSTANSLIATSNAALEPGSPAILAGSLDCACKRKRKNQHEKGGLPLKKRKIQARRRPPRSIAMLTTRGRQLFPRRWLAARRLSNYTRQLRNVASSCAQRRRR